MASFISGALPSGGTSSTPGLGLPGVYNPTASGYNYAGTSTPGTALPAFSSVPTNSSGTASALDALNVAAQQAANAGRIPNAPGLEAQSSANIGSELQGQLPPDVLAMEGRLAPEAALGAGGNSNIDYMKLLGLTSLQEQQQGQTDLSSALARNPAAPLVDPTQFVITPYQQEQFGLQEQQAQQQQQQFAANLALQQEYATLAQQRQQLQDALLAQQLGGNRGTGVGPWTPPIAPSSGQGYSPAPVSYSPLGTGTYTGSTVAAPTVSDVVGTSAPDKYAQWWQQYGGTTGGEIPGVAPGTDYAGDVSGSGLDIYGNPDESGQGP